MTQETVSNDFLEWKKDPFHKMYEHVKPLGANILIRLYYFDASKYDNDNFKLYLDMESNKKVVAEIESGFYPIAKILAVGSLGADYNHLKPGDLIYVDDFYTDSRVNPEWIQFQAMLKEKPSMEKEYEEKGIPIPKLYVGNIAQWEQYRFQLDKFNPPTEVDNYTFILQERYIKAEHVEN